MTAAIPRSQRFRHGLDVYDHMTGGEFGQDLSPGLNALERNFPFLVDAAMSYAIGDTWGRTEMDPGTREIAMIAALGVVGAGAATQLRQHVGYALTLGVSPDLLRELVYMTTVSAGFPKALNMAAEIVKVFDERGVGPAPAEPEQGVDRQARGLEELAQLGGVPVFDIGSHPDLGPLGKTFPFLVGSVVDYAIEDVWTRPAIEPSIRQIAMIAALGALGDGWPQYRIHIEYALRLGVRRTTLAEVPNILSVAVGFPIALNAASAMQAVFEEQDR